jgi:hypothetical protein
MNEEVSVCVCVCGVQAAERLVDPKMVVKSTRMQPNPTRGRVLVTVKEKSKWGPKRGLDPVFFSHQ